MCVKRKGGGGWQAEGTGIEQVNKGRKGRGWVKGEEGGVLWPRGVGTGGDISVAKFMVMVAVIQGS